MLRQVDQHCSDSARRRAACTVWEGIVVANVRRMTLMDAPMVRRTDAWADLTACSAVTAHDARLGKNIPFRWKTGLSRPPRKLGARRDFDAIERVPCSSPGLDNIPSAVTYSWLLTYVIPEAWQHGNDTDLNTIGKKKQFFSTHHLLVFETLTRTFPPLPLLFQRGEDNRIFILQIWKKKKNRTTYPLWHFKKYLDQRHSLELFCVKSDYILFSLTQK